MDESRNPIADYLLTGMIPLPEFLSDDLEYPSLLKLNLIPEFADDEPRFLTSSWPMLRNI